jgi:hypothetical protein
MVSGCWVRAIAASWALLELVISCRFLWVQILVTVGSIRERLLRAVQKGEVSTETSAMKGCRAMKASSFFVFFNSEKQKLCSHQLSEPLA